MYKVEDMIINLDKVVKKKIPINKLLTSDKFEFKEMVQNFYRSCAALTIFDYILGTKDRKAENIFIGPTGHIFR